VSGAKTVLMFVGKQCGRAAEAIEFYARAVPGFEVGEVVRITDPAEPRVGDVQRAEFTIGGTPFKAFDSDGPHAFGFTPACSIWVDLESESTLDDVYAQLSDDGTVRMPVDDYGFSRRFAWVDDRFGVSWQLNVAVDAAP